MFMERGCKSPRTRRCAYNRGTPRPMILSSFLPFSSLEAVENTLPAWVMESVSSRLDVLFGVNIRSFPSLPSPQGCPSPPCGLSQGSIRVRRDRDGCRGVVLGWVRVSTRTHLALDMACHPLLPSRPSVPMAIEASSLQPQVSAGLEGFSAGGHPLTASSWEPRMPPHHNHTLRFFSVPPPSASSVFLLRSLLGRQPEGLLLV